MNSDAKVVRGLSIATVVISVLALLGVVVLFAFSALSGSALADSSVMNQIMDQLNSDPDFPYYVTQSDVSSIVALMVGLCGVLAVWVLICSAIPLVAGILGIRNCSKPEKLGGAFGWAIAGAVVSLLMGNLITMVLLIISAVYINRVRKGGRVPYGYGQPAPAGYAPQAPYGQQPYGQAPMQGQPAPYDQVPAQPTQPAAYGQPQQAAPYGQPVVPPQPGAAQGAAPTQDPAAGAAQDGQPNKPE